jgi:hypothetical protein
MRSVTSIMVAIGVVAVSTCLAGSLAAAQSSAPGLVVTASRMPPPCRCGAGAGGCVVQDGRGNRICSYPNGTKCSFSGPGENC